MPEHFTAPRGRHAPPLEVRLNSQRERLIAAAARVFARRGYAAASSESIARDAGMSKATFYEHFDNREDCIVALFDAAAATVMEAMVVAATAAGSDPEQRMRAGVHAVLATMAEQRDAARTFLVEIVGAGERAIARRDAIVAAFAEVLDRENAEAARRGLAARTPSRDDAYAVVGAIAELSSRQLRRGEPADPRELEPVVDRLIVALMAQPPPAR